MKINSTSNIHYLNESTINSKLNERRKALAKQDKLREERIKQGLGEILGTPVLKCGHAETYAAYSDSDKCMLCDKLMIGGVV